MRMGDRAHVMANNNVAGAQLRSRHSERVHVQQWASGASGRQPAKTAAEGPSLDLKQLKAPTTRRARPVGCDVNLQ